MRRYAELVRAEWEATMTNFEKIMKSATAKELADLITHNCEHCIYDDACNQRFERGHDCNEGIENWLCQKVE